MNNKEKIKLIKYLRLKPSDRFILDHLTDLEEYTHNKYPNSTFYKKNDILFFEWNKSNGYFWCDYVNFWSVLESKYNLDYQKIKYPIEINGYYSDIYFIVNSKYQLLGITFEK